MVEKKRFVKDFIEENYETTLEVQRGNFHFVELYCKGINGYGFSKRNPIDTLDYDRGRTIATGRAKKDLLEKIIEYYDTYGCLPA